MTETIHIEKNLVGDALRSQRIQLSNSRIFRFIPMISPWKLLRHADRSNNLNSNNLLIEDNISVGSLILNSFSFMFFSVFCFLSLFSVGRSLSLSMHQDIFLNLRLEVIIDKKKSKERNTQNVLVEELHFAGGPRPLLCNTEAWWRARRKRTFRGQFPRPASPMRVYFPLTTCAGRQWRH